MAEDFIMRYVRELGVFLGKALSGNVNPNEVFFQNTYLTADDGDTAYFRVLLRYLEEGQVGQAEDKLFTWVEDNLLVDPVSFTALFYDTLRQWDETKLNNNGFSKEEITDGENAMIQLLLSKNIPYVEKEKD